MMTREKALYTEDRLVSLYDVLNRWGADNDFYARLAGTPAKRILDAGCGTGMLAVEYARAGHHVVGIDPAPRMLDAAAARDGGHLVDWQRSTLQDFKGRPPFDLIVMTGHAFQCLLTDDDILAAFRSVSRLLGKKGRFVFESRNPEARAWESWTPENSGRRERTEEGLEFTTFNQVLDVSGGLVTFESRYTFEGDTRPLISRSTLRFASLDRIGTLARSEGLRVAAVYGDWDSSGLTAESPELIVTMEK